MKHKILFPLFAIGLFLYSCSKDSEGSPDNNNPGTDSVLASYSTGNTLLIDQLALYTQHGIVTDAATIQSYLDRNVFHPDAKRLFYVNRPTVDNHGIAVNMDILKSNRARFKNEIMEITALNDTSMLIADYDSIAVPAHNGSACGPLLESVPAITPWSNCTSGICPKYRTTYPVSISGDNYYLPTLYYAVTKYYLEVIDDKEVISTCTSVSQEYPMFNTLSPEMINRLGERDTVLAQTGRIPFIKKSK